MNIPIAVPCFKCGDANVVAIELHAPSLDFTCTRCGERNAGSFGLDFTTGDRLLRRADHEWCKNRDAATTIVFSAMAMDCEVSRLYRKWEQIKNRLNLVELSDEDLDERLRKLGNVAKRIDGVASQMYAPGLDRFVASRADLTDTIKNGFPNLTLGQLARSFQEALFWPRNRVLHLGDTSFDDAVTTRCFNVAVLGIHVLQQLDLEARKAH